MVHQTRRSTRNLSCDSVSSLNKIARSLSKYARMTVKELLGKHKKSKATRRKRGPRVQKHKK